MPTQDPWERREAEGETPYLHFRSYLTLPLPRPDLGTYAKTRGLAKNTIQVYSSRFDWTERLAAWDAHIARAEEEVILTERQQLTRDHLQALRAARTLGTVVITGLLQRAEETGRTEGVDARTALALVKQSAELERLIVGEATERVETRDLDLDLSGLSAAEAETLLSLLAKMADGR